MRSVGVGTNNETETGNGFVKNSANSTKIGTKRRRGRPRKNPENSVKSDNNLNSQNLGTGTKCTKQRVGRIMLDRDKLSPTIRLLFDKAIELDAQKTDVTYRTLSEAAPNHSKRDYLRAIDILEDFKSELDSTSLPMPNELKSWFDKGIQGMWARGCSWLNEQKALIEKTADEKVVMARKDRDEVNDKCESLTHQFQDLSIELSETQSQINN